MIRIVLSSCLLSSFILLLSVSVQNWPVVAQSAQRQFLSPAHRQAESDQFATTTVRHAVNKSDSAGRFDAVELCATAGKPQIGDTSATRAVDAETCLLSTAMSTHKRLVSVEGPAIVAPISSRQTEPIDLGEAFQADALDAESSDEQTIFDDSEYTSQDAKPAVSPELIALSRKVRDVLTYYYRKDLNTRDHGPWEIMHSFIAYGVDTQLRLDGPGGSRVSAIGWLCFNGRCRGQFLFYPTSGGNFAAAEGPGLQGHPGQFLAMLAQSNVVPEYPLKVAGRDYTIMDLVRYEQASCRPNSELTFKLIGLVHYLDSDAQWTTGYGERWDIPRLIREELAQPIRGATCGGTHRLFGLSYAVQKRSKRGEPIIGEWARAAKFIKDYHAYTFKLQNSDGSFSTRWFSGRGNQPDVDRKLQTTGHILEWLAFSLPDNELLDPQTVRAVDFLATILQQGKNRDWAIGPRGHALHALVMYDQRVFRPLRELQAPLPIAQQANLRTAQKPATHEK